jgi:hypothetical protein
MKRDMERYAVRIATVSLNGNRVMAGCIIIRTFNMLKATTPVREGVAPTLPFDLLEKIEENTLGAQVVILSVVKKFRRNGIASLLLNACMQEVLSQTPCVPVVFAYAPRGDEVMESFFNECHKFTEFGFIKDFKEKQDYSLWAQEFHDGSLACYHPVAGDVLPDLFDAELKRKRPVPKWVVDLGLQFGLPVLVVVVLFGISYFLVWLGPLKGISSKYMNGPQIDVLEDENEDL